MKEKVVNRIREISLLDISYEEKTLNIIREFHDIFVDNDFVLSLNDNKIIKYSPFMFTRYQVTEELKEVRGAICEYAFNFKESFFDGLEELKQESGLLAIGTGCLDKNGVMMVGMAPGFYNNNEFDKLSSPFKPSFFFASTSEMLREGFLSCLDHVYFTNLSKLAFSKKIHTSSLYQKLYDKCFKFLEKEIKILKPGYIVSLGVDVSRYLDEKKVIHIKAYHPSYFLMRHERQSGIDYFSNISKSFLFKDE